MMSRYWSWLIQKNGRRSISRSRSVPPPNAVTIARQYVPTMSMRLRAAVIIPDTAQTSTAAASSAVPTRAVFMDVGGASAAGAGLVPARSGEASWRQGGREGRPYTSGSLVIPAGAAAAERPAAARAPGIRWNRSAAASIRACRDERGSGNHWVRCASGLPARAAEASEPIRLLRPSTRCPNTHPRSRSPGRRRPRRPTRRAAAQQTRRIREVWARRRAPAPARGRSSASRPAVAPSGVRPSRPRPRRCSCRRRRETGEKRKHDPFAPADRRPRSAIHRESRGRNRS